MFKSLLIVSLYFISIQLFAAEEVNLNVCTHNSKDPRCIRRTPQFSGITNSRGELQCSFNGQAYYKTYDGEGGGCGESGKTIISKQYNDWSNKIVYIQTKWRAGSRQGTGYPPMCHYWGPIYGGGTINANSGNWKVIVDGKEVGSFTLSLETSQDSNYESSSTKTCKIHLN